jgi:hypothetical protein
MYKSQQKSEAHLLFLEEVREKKKAASGVHHKTGKRGYVGKMLFPSDIMSRKEKYNYRKSGKVMTSNIYDTVLPLNELLKLETHEQRNRLAYWRTQYDNKSIQNMMSTNNSTYYELVKTLGLSRPPNRNPGKPRTGRSTTPKAIEASKIESLPSPAAIPSPIQEIMVNGLHLIYNGTYSSDIIQKQLLKFCTLLDDEANSFYIELKIVEKIEK